MYFYQYIDSAKLVSVKSLLNILINISFSLFSVALVFTRRKYYLTSSAPACLTAMWLEDISFLTVQFTSPKMHQPSFMLKACKPLFSLGIMPIAFKDLVQFIQINIIYLIYNPSMALGSKVLQCHPYELVNTFLYICWKLRPIMGTLCTSSHFRTFIIIALLATPPIQCFYGC